MTEGTNIQNKSVDNAPNNKALIRENKQLKVGLEKSKTENISLKKEVEELKGVNLNLKGDLEKHVREHEVALSKESELKEKANIDLNAEKEAHVKSIKDKDEEIVGKLKEKDDEIKVKIEEKDLELTGIKSLLPPVPKVYEVIEEYQGIKVGVEYLESSFKPSIINHMLKKGYWKEKECK